MREYEVVYIFESALDQSVIEGKLERFNELITGNGGEITAVEHWGKRQLAYSLNNHDNGYYVVIQFRTEPETLTEFERAIKLDEGVLRHLVVLSEGELPTPRSSVEASRGDEDEDEDDDEDEDEDDED